MLLTKQQILQADDRRPVRVDVPEWGDGAFVYVLPMSGSDRDWYDQYQCELRFPEGGKEPDWRGLRAGALSRGLCDEGGKLLGFTDAEVLELGDKNGAAIERCFETLKRLSGLGPDEETAAKND